MDNKQDNRYEALYTQLLEHGLDMHMNNKSRIRKGLILLLLLPFILGIILKLTDSDKIVFLIIWVICMFVISIYLITIEYIDDSIQKTLEDVTDRETEFDELFTGTEQIEERINERHERIREKIRTQLENRHWFRKDVKEAEDAEEPEESEEPEVPEDAETPEDREESEVSEAPEVAEAEDSEELSSGESAEPESGGEEE